MELLIIALVSLAASCLTFLCGFGLGTILTPVFFVLFRDLEFAIAATAVVHLLNNVFKFFLMKKSIDWSLALRFGATAVPFALLGAFALHHFGDINLFSWSAGDLFFDVNLLNLTFGAVLIFFSLMEVIPSLGNALSAKNVLLGGALSGFFGGLSGHQGALRSAFLLRYQLGKEVFIATGIVIALAIDFTRLPVYLIQTDLVQLGENWPAIAISLGFAFIGAFAGKFILRKIELKILNALVAVLMLVFGLMLASGIFDLWK